MKEGVEDEFHRTTLTRETHQEEEKEEGLLTADAGNEEDPECDCGRRRRNRGSSRSGRRSRRIY